MVGYFECLLAYALICAVRDVEVELETCDVLMNEHAKSFVGCYEDNMEEIQDSDDDAECQSAATYKHGFRDARATLSAPIAIYENVRDVMASKRDANGILRPPQIQTVVEDFLDQGCHFTYRMCQTSRYLLPQRRQRVYGVASLHEQRPERMNEEFDLAMTMMESHARQDGTQWPMDTFLGATAPSEVVKRQRYLRPEEHLLLQGIWPWSYEGSACQALKRLAQSTSAKACAGNAFSTTTALSACLASLVSSSGWFIIAQRHHTCQIPDVPAENLDDSSQSLRRAAIERGISSSEASSFAPFGISLRECHHQLALFEAPAKPEVSRSADPESHLDNWLEEFMDKHENELEDKKMGDHDTMMPSTSEAFHQVKPVPAVKSECLRTPRATKHEVQNGDFSSKKRKAPGRARHQLRDQGGHPARVQGEVPGSHQPKLQGKVPGSHQPEVQGEVPAPHQPEVQGEVDAAHQPEDRGEAMPAKKRRLRGKQSGAASGFDVAEVVQKAPEPCPPDQCEDEEDEPEKKRHKRGDSISIAKKLAAVKQYEELVQKHGKKIGCYKGVMSQTKWLGARVREKWDSFCETCPRDAAKRDKVPNWARKSLGMNMLGRVPAAFPVALQHMCDNILLQKLQMGMEISPPGIADLIESLLKEYNSQVQEVNQELEGIRADFDDERDGEKPELVRLATCKLTRGNLDKLASRFACRFHWGFFRNEKPGRHLEYNNPQVVAIRQWISNMIEAKKINPRLVGNWDQVWTLMYEPLKKIAYKQGHAAGTRNMQDLLPRKANFIDGLRSKAGYQRIAMGWNRNPADAKDEDDHEMGNSGEPKFQIALTSSLESDAYALQCIREYQQGKLVLWAWSSRGYSTLEDIAAWHCGGDVAKAAELLAPMEKGVFTEYIKGKELPSLHILGEEKAVRIPDDKFLSGEKIHIWFVDRGEDGNIPLPNWFSLPIELAISVWRKEEQDWEAKKTARSPKPLTANQQKLYDSWLENSTRRIVLDQSHKTQIAHPASVSKQPLRVRQFEITETMPDGQVPPWLYMSEVQHVADKMASAQDDEELDPEDGGGHEDQEQIYSEGGKHAYAADSNEEELEEEPEDVNGENVDEDSLPDWIACLKGIHFFTLTQALNSPSAMHLRVSGDDMTTYLQGLVFNKKSTSTRKWTRVNFSKSDFESVLPPRKGCRMQRWWPANSIPRFQVWYPKNPDDAHESHTFSGEKGFEDAKAWAWDRHKKWLLLNSMNSKAEK
eukprot:Skav220991  [mRNA]  locus=scaffold1541:250564:259672:- [translate_table: standard]